MSTPTPTGGVPATPQPPCQAPAVTTRPRGRRLLSVGVVLLLLAGAGGTWWWLQPTPVAPPPLGQIEDLEVRRAIARARQQVVDSPQSAAAWGRLGKLLLTHMRAEDAEFCFAQAARLDPADPRWPYARGWLAVRHDPEKPVTWLREAVAKAEARPEARSVMTLQLAEVLLERGDVGEAERLFRQELVRAPDNRRAAFGLGLVTAARGDRPAALKFFTIARDSPYARKKASAQLAVLARAQGEREAADRYEKLAAALPADPPWPDPLHDELRDLRVGRLGRERRARMLEKEGRYAEAAAVYLEQTDNRPSVGAYVRAGLNLTRQRDFDRALPILREAVRLGPADAEAHFCLALALYTRAEERLLKAAPAQAREVFREAVGHARQAADLRPGHSETYLIWGQSLAYLGEREAAVEALRKGITCAPGNVRLQLGIGEVLLELGRLKEAEEHLKIARRLAPNDPRPARALERLRLRKG